jgi:hypothetical protein
MFPFQLTYEFEELSLGAATLSGIEWGLEARAWGRAIIEYDGAGDWTVADIEIATTRKIASAGRDRWVDGYAWLDRNEPLFMLIAAALLRERDDIESRIANRMPEDGVTRGDPNAEHRTLNHAQTGVAA